MTMTSPFGWYGSRQLTPVECFTRLDDRSAADAVSPVDPASTDVSAQPLFVRFGPTEFLRRAMADRVANPGCADNTAAPRYQLVSRYDGDSARLRWTAEKMSALTAAAGGQAARMGWVIVNDKAGVPAAELTVLIPPPVQPIAVVKSSEQTPMLDTTLGATDWIVHLGGGRACNADAIAVLDHYIRTFKKCRCIVAGTIDVDEAGNELARHRAGRNPSLIGEAGSAGGHIVAIRRDLMEELDAAEPGLVEASAATIQLLAAMREAVLSIPDYIGAQLRSVAPSAAVAADRDNRAFNRLRKRILSQTVEDLWPDARMAKLRARPPKLYRRGICLVRTQGARPALLAEAVHSIGTQSIPTTPCIVVHGAKATYEKVRQWASGLAFKTVVLHADDPAKLRGYPFNVGLGFIRDHARDFDFMCILDDDDIYYPYFAARMSEALTLSDADVVYSLANRREPPSPPLAGWQPRPAACLVGNNFIPTNALAIKVDTLISSGVQFREDMNYLEDWDFLLSFMTAGARFHCVQETLSEFRVIGDGNRAEKQDTSDYGQCLDRVTARGRLAAKLLGWPHFYRTLLDYESDRNEMQSADIVNDLIRARRVFETDAAAPT